MKIVDGLLFGIGCLASAAALAGAIPGNPAPNFTVADTAGKPVSLAGFKGKYVVLEWNNPNCPFVQKHYVSGNMQALQKRGGADEVVWLAVNSTASSHSDYMSPQDLSTWFAKSNARPNAILMDTAGDVARTYGARVTPHMFVIDPAGKLIYAGAIDDKRSSNPADVKTSFNYVIAALVAARAGKPVDPASTSAYGCSIKYQ